MHKICINSFEISLFKNYKILIIITKSLMTIFIRVYIEGAFNLF